MKNKELKGILKNTSDVVVAYALCSVAFRKERADKQDLIDGLGMEFAYFKSTHMNSYRIENDCAIPQVRDISQVAPENYKAILNYENEIRTLLNMVNSLQEANEKIDAELQDEETLTVARQKRIILQKEQNNQYIQLAIKEYYRLLDGRATFERFVTDERSINADGILGINRRTTILGDKVLNNDGRQYMDGHDRIHLFYDDLKPEHKIAIQKLREEEREI